MNRRNALKAITGGILGLVGIRRAEASFVMSYDGVVWIDSGPVHWYGDTNGTILPEMVLVPMPDMEPGRAYCPICDGLTEITFPWIGPDHVAVRLWDDNHELRALQMPTRVAVDGMPLTLVLEAYAGPFGWVLVENAGVCPRCRIEHDRMLIVGNVTFDQPSRDSAIAHMGTPFVDSLESRLLETTKP